MAGAASAHQATTASREESGQRRTGRTRRTTADPQRAQQGATAAAAAAPAELDSMSRLQQLADASPQVAQLRRLQALADARFAPVAQLAGGPEEELVQGKFASAQLQPQLQQAPRANNTGLPDQLKSGIESLSGLSMDHVRVHYNSSQPAQLNALAYSQGSEIHVAPWQEQHLPHEAWHVVQQAQGRVRPTMQMKDGVPVNDDPGLEREADVMGTKALEGGHRAVETHRSISMPIEPAQQLERDTMNSPDVKAAKNHSAPLANGRGAAQRSGNEMQRIADQRPEAALQRQVQAWGDGSERVGQLRAWHGVADGRGLADKRQDLTTGFAGFAQLPIVQPKWIQRPKDPIYMWDEIIGAFRWYFNSSTNKMFFRIENAEELSQKDYARLINFNNIEFSHDEWVEKGWGIGNWAKGDNEIMPSWKLKLNRMIEKANLLVEMGVLATSPDQKGIARSYWGEALNPKHRPVEGHDDPKAQVNLRERYAKDEEAQLRFNFYDWLDSKDVPVGDQVIYMDENMRKQYEAIISGLKIEGGGINEKYRDYAFVLSAADVIYAAPKQTKGAERIHHSSFMAGAAVACAGIFFVQPGGQIFYVKDYSGHYQPGIPELMRLKKYLIGIGSGEVTLWKQTGKEYKGAIKDWPEN